MSPSDHTTRVSVLVYQSIILVVGVYDFDVLLHWMWRLHTWRDTNPLVYQEFT